MKNRTIKTSVKTSVVLSAILILILSLTACAHPGSSGKSPGGSSGTEIIDNGDGSYSCEVFAMDTVMNLKAYGDHAEKALSDASSELIRLDGDLDVTNEDSLICALNQRKTDTAGGDTAAVIRQSLRMAELTDGCFDPTIYPIVRAWGFTTEKYRIPDEKEIHELLSHVGYTGVSISDVEDGGLRIAFSDDQTEIDTGGIGKGYASEVIYRVMKEDGVESAVVSLGGNVMTIGSKPDGSRWKVAIEDPDNSDSGNYAGVIQLADKFAITSGGYQRFFEKNGKKYIHIMDPASGHPVDNDLSSVTIVSESGTEGDALSTALYVMGLEKAQEFWKTTDLEFEAILITTEKELYVTEGIADSFTSDYGSLHTITRQKNSD